MATQHISHPMAHQLAPTSTPFRRFSQRSGEFLLEQWPAIITGILGLIVFTAISVPILSYLGLDSISKPIFFSLHFVCAQIPSHSFYLFGHQLGLCARNFSIYTSMFLGSLIFTLSKKRMPGLPWWGWVLLCLPMAWDGLTQMFGLRESSWELRLLTGSLFGFGCIWFALPFMQKTLEDTTPIPAHLIQRPAASQLSRTTKPITTKPIPQEPNNEQ